MVFKKKGIISYMCLPLFVPKRKQVMKTVYQLFCFLFFQALKNPENEHNLSDIQSVPQNKS